MKHIGRFVLIMSLGLATACSAPPKDRKADDEQPAGVSVLMISIDDLNDWNTAYAVRTEDWTYIKREDGEELYHRPNDPHQWHNLAADPANRVIMDELAKHIPEQQAEVFKRK
jgi:arylsulfatase A-like enzyme